MLNIVLIAHAYAEMGTPSGLATAALAQAFAARGHAVHVICAVTPAPRPRHEHLGLVTIHRLELRRGSKPQAFALQASRRVSHLMRSRRCDAIECIDAPACLLSIAALRCCMSMRPPLIDVVVNPEARADHQCPAETGFADTVVYTAKQGSNHDPMIPLPIGEPLWSPPQIPAPVFVVCDSTDQRTDEFIMHAYQRSQAPARGWSLALRSRDGRWTVHGSDTKATGEPRTVLISSGTASPVASLHALRQGFMSIVDHRSPLLNTADDLWPLMFQAGDHESLIAMLDRATQTPPGELREQAERWSQQLGPIHDPATVVRAHEKLINNMRVARESPTAHAAWCSLEQQLATPFAGAHA